MSKEADLNCDGDSSTDEGDHNKSFVTKVKSHMTGLLPSKLSTWLGAKPRQRDELEDDDDDTYELQPPPKRVKTHNLNFDMNNITALHSQLPNPFSQEFREPAPGMSSSHTTRKLVLPTPNHYSQSPTEQTNGVDSDSGESTSGYSSMPHIGSKEQVSELPGGSNAQPSHSGRSTMNKSIFNTSIPLERSLFGEHFTSPKGGNSNASLSLRRPSFNASAFSSNTFIDKTLSTRRIFNSPFYSGRITYGGASAYNRLQSVPSMRSTPSPSVQPKLINENKSAALSRTAKRILDTLEQYTSPAQDVRRIPTDRRAQRLENSLIGQYVGANPYTVREPTRQPSNKELQVPTTSDLLKMKLKERLQDSTTSVRAIASHSVSPLNAEEYSIGNSDDAKQTSGKSTNKMKTKVTSVRQKSMPDDDVMPVIKLPNVQLPISTLPNFNFAIPPSKVDVNPPTDNTSQEKTTTRFLTGSSDPKGASSSVTLPKTPDILPAVNFKNPEFKSATFLPTTCNTSTMNAIPKLPLMLDETKQLVNDTSTGAEFKFSKPLVIAENTFKSLKAINNFKFSHPLVKKVLNGLPQIKKVDIIANVALPKTGFGDLFKRDRDKWECNICLVKNISSATSCISCTTPRATKAPATNGPVKPPAPTTTTMSLMDRFKPPADSWTCSVCMITNKSASESCAACTTPKQATSAATKVVDAIGFKKKENDMLCPKCNSVNVNGKCVCSETPKSGAALSSQSKSPVIANLWGDKFKASASTWECSVCLIPNELSRDKCAACESQRPAGSTGQKGVDWECTSCLVRNPNNKEKCVCCEAPKPCSKSVPTAQVKEVPKFSLGIENGLINRQGFVFGIPADKNVKTMPEEEKAGAAETVTTAENSAPSSQFLFGIKSPNGAKHTLSTTTTEVKPVADNVLKFSFGIPSGSKRPASKDEGDAPLKKTESDIALKANVVNGSIMKTEPAKLTFGVMSNPTGDTQKNLFGDQSDSKTTAQVPMFAANKTTAAAAPAYTFSSALSTPVSPKTCAAVIVTPEKAPPTAAPSFKFNSTVSSVPAPMFGTGSHTTNGSTSPVFSFSAPKSFAKPKEAIVGFKFSTASNNPKPATAINSFASAKSPTASGMFGAPAANALSVFGGSGLQQTSAPPAQTASSFGGAIFGSGSSSSNSGAAPATFGTPKMAAPNFTAPGPALSPPPPPYTPANASAFAKPNANGIFNFGSSASQVNEPKQGFNFGPPVSTPGGFTFGAAAPMQNTNGAFNFGAGGTTAQQFNAAVKPTFNFTANSSASTAATPFSAQPNDTKQPPPGRIIRRALRRTQR